MLLNAISINTSRFCAFFNSIDTGGISMQLLLDSFWKKVYCENCQLQMKLGKLPNKGFETSGSELVFNN